MIVVKLQNKQVVSYIMASASYIRSDENDACFCTSLRR